MKPKVLFIFLLFCTYLCSSQPATINQQLDSVMNVPMTRKVKFIYTEGSTLVVDSLPVKKLQAGKKDSSILVTYYDKTQKRIKTNEFWGIITD